MIVYSLFLSIFLSQNVYNEGKCLKPAKRNDSKKKNSKVIMFMQLDEGQVQFVRALESKCVNSSGMISKVELRGIFKNFGFPVNATTLEHFLAK